MSGYSANTIARHGQGLITLPERIPGVSMYSCVMAMARRHFPRQGQCLIQMEAIYVRVKNPIPLAGHGTPDWLFASSSPNMATCISRRRR